MDDKFVLTASNDKTARLFDINSGICLFVFEYKDLAVS